MFELYLREVKDLGPNTSMVLSSIKPSETIGEFFPILNASLAAKSSGTPLLKALSEVHTAFYDWIPTKEFDDIIALLKAFSAVLDFEMNKPYRYWYSEEQREVLKLKDDVKKTLEELAERAQKADDKYSDLSAELKIYIKTSQKGYEEAEQQQL